MTGSRVAHAVAERAARESYGKLLAYLAKRCGQVDAAEDALADAFAAALDHWPAHGVPAAPEAWLLVAARHRLTDGARRAARAQRFHDRLVDAAREAQNAFDRSAELADDRLGLLFACAHPAIAAEIRAPLMLQTVLGLDAARIAAAFLIAPAAMSQRLVRAKQKIAAAGIPLTVPPQQTWPQRLDAVLTAIYTAFTQGWDDPDDSDPRTRGFTAEALWLGGMLVTLCPGEPEVAGLLALMRYAQARHAARRDAAGAYVPLDRQDVRRWDAAAIRAAEALLARGRAVRARRTFSTGGGDRVGAHRTASPRCRQLGRGRGAVRRLCCGARIRRSSHSIAPWRWGARGDRTPRSRHSPGSRKIHACAPINRSGRRARTSSRAPPAAPTLCTPTVRRSDLPSTPPSAGISRLGWTASRVKVNPNWRKPHGRRGASR